MEKELKELPAPKVSILIALNNYWQNVFTLNKILSTCDVDIPIEIIATNNTGDNRVFDFLSNLLVDPKSMDFNNTFKVRGYNAYVKKFLEDNQAEIFISKPD
jgi:hypothetical protein